METSLPPVIADSYVNTADGTAGRREGAGVDVGGNGNLPFVYLHREMLLLKFLWVGWNLLILTGNENCKREMTDTETGLSEGKVHA